jgi:hypothetical protein
MERSNGYRRKERAMPEGRKGAQAPQGKQPAKSPAKQQDQPSEGAHTHRAAPQEKKELSVTAHVGPHVPVGSGPGTPPAGVEPAERLQDEPTQDASPKVKVSSSAKRGSGTVDPQAVFLAGLRRQGAVSWEPNRPHDQVVQLARRVDRTTNLVVAEDSPLLTTSEVASRLRERASNPPEAE